jgi:hypothetical protein
MPRSEAPAIWEIVVADKGLDLTASRPAPTVRCGSPSPTAVASRA